MIAIVAGFVMLVPIVLFMNRNNTSQHNGLSAWQLWFKLMGELMILAILGAMAIGAAIVTCYFFWMAASCALHGCS